MASGPVTTQRMVRFGDGFELDMHSWTLRRGDRTLKLERIPMQLLLLLVERRPEIVTRAEIAEAIWGKDAFLDTDNSINGAVRKIRYVLRDNPEEPRFIQTIPGKGYRFIAEILNQEPSPDVNDGVDSFRRVEPPENTAVQNEPSRAVVPQQLSEARARSRHPSIWIALGGALILLAALASQLRFGSRASKPAAPRKVVLAVLPFENLTGDPAQEYFSDGITEEMI
ncbi:MAG TPA: winged helix-turn-helix domain-containing protein, partial [Acidobacteriaceae bacterium]|nr:winged helix-turn-helix domain-containing protein [Acidobacteriaceae bacterium]